MDILSKSIDVASKKLDIELLEMGYTPEQVESMPPVAKKTNFFNGYTSKTIKSASGDISGIVPIQSVVVIDKNGNAQVAVILVWSRKTVQIAKDISLQRPSLITGKGRDLKDMLPRNNEEKLGLRGVRLVYDESGCPVIVSYGLASFVSDTDDYAINSELKQDAKNAASDMADALIAEMVKGYMSAENMREQGEEVERYVEKAMSQDAMSVEKTVRNIIDMSNRRAKSAARMKMTGISTLESKFFTLPSGQQFVYCVRAWKYDTLKAMQDLDAPILPTRKADEKSQSDSRNSGVYGGRKMNTLEDF